ncbi:MAG: DUF998 domain-containing protein [Acidobacteriota bacterium]|nr:DUF998 domain-containing protein [Acidobacteriota bacterium]
MKSSHQSAMNGLHANRSITICLLAATAMPIIYFATQIAAAPFYPGYSFSLHSVSMLGTHFSRHPWIFNAGEMLTGFAALAAAVGLYHLFREKTHFLLSVLIGFAVACIGVMCLKAGMFPMPDPRHNSWGFLQNFIIITPLLMLVGLWKQSHSSGLRTYLILSVTFLLLLVPLSPRLGHGTFQRLIAFGTLVPVGVIGFFFWRELHRGSLDPPDSKPAASNRS